MSNRKKSHLFDKTTLDEIEGLLNSIIQPIGFLPKDPLVKLDLLEHLLNTLRHQYRSMSSREALESFLSRQFWVNDNKIYITAPFDPPKKSIGTPPIRLQPALLRHLLIFHNQNFTVHQIIESFIRDIWDELETVDFKRTATGVMRCHTNTRFAASALRNHGLLLFTDKEAYKTWRLSLPGFIVAAKLSEKGVLSPADTGDCGVILHKEIIDATKVMDSYNSFVCELNRFCEPQKAIFKSYRKVLKSAHDTWFALLDIVNDSKLNKQEKRAKCLKLIKELERRKDINKFYDEFSLAMLNSELLKKVKAEIVTILNPENNKQYTKQHEKYDIIGDIHGCAQTLESLLIKLGYRSVEGVWRHAERKTIFLGDFIDRGPYQREVISIVRPMIDAGAAYSVMGNHEFNAIAFFTKDANGKYLREHTEGKINQHKAFLSTYEKDYEGWLDVINWFKKLPLWLEADGLNIIHACWDLQEMEKLKSNYNVPFLSDELLYAANDKATWEYDAIDTLLKGKEIPLPAGHSFSDKDGTERKRIRVRWWDQSAKTYRAAFMGPEAAITHIPDDPLAGDHLIEYSHKGFPLFIGHYWLNGTPTPLASNIACLDYSVANPSGKLVAYRWDGERTLRPNKFVAVKRLEPTSREAGDEGSKLSN